MSCHDIYVTYFRITRRPAYAVQVRLPACPLARLPACPRRRRVHPGWDHNPSPRSRPPPPPLYSQNELAPIILITVLSASAYWNDGDAYGDRLGIMATSLLSMMALQAYVSSNLPPVPVRDSAGRSAWFGGGGGAGSPSLGC